MQKTILLVLIVILLLTLIGTVLLSKSCIHLGVIDKGTVIFVYQDYDISTTITEYEISIIYNIVDRKILYKDAPSCGFSEDVCIKLDDGYTLCIARDMCPIIYWKEKDAFLKISEEEKEVLHHLLSNYGVFFPCV